MALVISLNTQSFDKKSAEIAFYQRVLELAGNEIGRAKGTATSGQILGVSPAGVANTSLGSWTFTPTAANP